ncbi:hypothetical protein D3C72_2527240 [compost metagenome]
MSAQVARAMRRMGGLRVMPCATPAMPEKELTLAKPVRLKRRYTSVGLSSRSALSTLPETV